MNKFNKKLYYKFFDLYQYSTFLQDEVIVNIASQFMRIIKENEDLDFVNISNNKAVELGLSEGLYEYLYEFQQRRNISFITDYCNRIPEWLKDIILPGYFSGINLGEIFAVNNIQTPGQLCSYFDSKDFIDKYGKEQSDLYKHYVHKSNWNNFPVKYAHTYNGNDILLNRLKHSRIYGNFHNHTTYSDGNLSLKQLIKLANEDRDYVGVSDHSKYCHTGIDEEKLFSQIEEIDKLNQMIPINILKSIECEILPNGDLDLTDDCLSCLDYVIIAIHTHSDMNKSEMMMRLLKAIENPYSKILAHPSARIYRKKPEIFIDMYKIIDACIRNNVVIEINGDPSRLDIDPKYIQYALEKGAMLLWIQIHIVKLGSKT